MPNIMKAKIKADGTPHPSKEQMKGAVKTIEEAAEALEKAREESARLDPHEWLEALEPIENGHDIEEMPVTEAPKRTMCQPQ